MLHRFPVGLAREVLDFSWESLAALPWEELDLAWPREAEYALQLSANLRLEWSFADLIGRLRQHLALPEKGYRARRPQVILSVYLLRQKERFQVFAGLSTPADNLSPWAGGQCRIPRDPEAVSRAESKLLEAWEAFGLEGLEPGAALDLGAAPGGWSRVLAGKGYSVDAVDPADLDSRVLALDQVTHHRQTAGSFLARHRRARFALIVSDMKMDAARAAALLTGCAPALKPGGGLLTTLKLGKGPGVLDEIERSLALLARAYQVRHARQLYFNRSEITVYAERLARD